MSHLDPVGMPWGSLLEQKKMPSQVLVTAPSFLGVAVGSLFVVAVRQLEEGGECWILGYPDFERPPRKPRTSKKRRSLAQGDSATQGASATRGASATQGDSATRKERGHA